ncbi:hypothetical protein H4J02_09035 [Protaetiibacter sp. SSC-01]|uniref:hypothetical protein n=1 Tax=Protaetiibacter sp. SSC-01 TaxID=2759943 RepID=UPI0016573CEB|nr:hypothetical protein [Protaetiibacter sp. SSC-01]QNO36644.1 hypothetical protein H4J02_09035 [Protaetiibacter sp. SSC-01]
MTVVTRIALAVLAANELLVGVWNQFWPDGFYADFPTVSLDPEYSEHYARDFGGATLGIALVLIAALIAPTGALVTTAGAAYTVFALPHFVFHAAHLEHASPADVAFLLIGNGLGALVGLFVIVLGVLRMGRERRRLRAPSVDGPARGGDRQRAGGGVRGAVP